MIELVFVIVILGILSAVAIPKLAATRIDAQISKGRADISSIRSSIITERQARLITGQPNFINSLSSSTTTLFDGNGTATSSLLMYGVKAGATDGYWSTDSTGMPYVSYIYKVGGSSCNFTYNPTNGTFNIDASQNAICDNLVD
ncbi:prepilin-type cleavage/methylation domain-containing protein [Sulfurimonas sp. SAG-AH-194-C21]|nr:prepilin-type cleavage/methylation domain-containing protein [Sulfurimonas sp. SAG-AH-194-C21]